MKFKTIILIIVLLLIVGAVIYAFSGDDSSDAGSDGAGGEDLNSQDTDTLVENSIPAEEDDADLGELI